ncbi:GNAT family N-acetyltransferase [Thalassobius vesicularis]|uniref:GNAT family N-acetyltransferase n=1 Tax=Thalassobius vesicularis TaxID=1294297 RepID=A0A4V3UZF3_9RHOB|nr:GNAT family N-acetyltransferase [Thalassobius vesicularis]THD76635.1 GNAT family N-acetyltransferase [Thalassobius vesicularis]
MNWQIEEAEGLDEVHALRRTVFIEEQGVPEADEWDDLDGSAVHLLARVDGVPVGTARLLIDGDTGRIGRICVARAARGTGLGAALVQDGIARLRAQGLRMVRLGAQVHATGFYEKLGFAVCGPVYDDAGIDHHEMEQTL